MNKKQIEKLKSEKYKPVPHDEEFDKKLFAKPGVKAAYDALEDEYAALDALLKARAEAGLSQAQLAKRMGIKQSALARIESSLGSRKHTPSLATLRKYAAACGKRLLISIGGK